MGILGLTMGLWDGGYGAVEVRRIQPYEATKTYVCPGCHQDIAPGTGHIVAVPAEATDLRRHWHKPCWAQREAMTKRQKAPSITRTRTPRTDTTSKRTSTP